MWLLRAVVFFCVSVICQGKQHFSHKDFVQDDAMLSPPADFKSSNYKRWHPYMKSAEEYGEMVVNQRNLEIPIAPPQEDDNIRDLESTLYKLNKWDDFRKESILLRHKYADSPKDEYHKQLLKNDLNEWVKKIKQDQAIQMRSLDEKFGPYWNPSVIEANYATREKLHQQFETTARPRFDLQQQRMIPGEQMMAMAIQKMENAAMAQRLNKLSNPATGTMNTVTSVAGRRLGIEGPLASPPGPPNGELMGEHVVPAPGQSAPRRPSNGPTAEAVPSRDESPKRHRWSPPTPENQLGKASPGMGRYWSNLNNQEAANEIPPSPEQLENGILGSPSVPSETSDNGQPRRPWSPPGAAQPPPRPPHRLDQPGHNVNGPPSDYPEYGPRGSSGPPGPYAPYGPRGQRYVNGPPRETPGYETRGPPGPSRPKGPYGYPGPHNVNGPSRETPGYGPQGPLGPSDHREPPNVNGPPMYVPAYGSLEPPGPLRPYDHRGQPNINGPPYDTSGYGPQGPSGPPGPYGPYNQHGQTNVNGPPRETPGYETQAHQGLSGPEPSQTQQQQRPPIPQYDDYDPNGPPRPPFDPNSAQYGAPGSSFRSPESYGPKTSGFQYGSPGSQYKPPGPSRSKHGPPISQHGPPGSQFGPPGQQYDSPGSQYSLQRSPLGPPPSEQAPPSHSQYQPPSKLRYIGSAGPPPPTWNWDMDQNQPLQPPGVRGMTNPGPEFRGQLKPLKPSPFSELPQRDDFGVPIEWVAMTLANTDDGLARVTDPKTGRNWQARINGTLYVPVIYHAKTTTTVRTTTTPSTTTPDPVMEALLQFVTPRNLQPQDWLAFDLTLNKKTATETCNADGCQARCHKHHCGSGCRGDTCSSGCIGIECSGMCQGPGCLAMCIGDNCRAQCQGHSCDARCIGKGCDAYCNSVSCHYTKNGDTKNGIIAQQNQYRYPQQEKPVGRTRTDAEDDELGLESNERIP